MTTLLTFEAFAAGQGTDLSTAIADDVTRLWQLYDDQSHRLARASRDQATDDEQWRDAMALEMFESLMGTRWTEDRIVGFRNCDLSREFLDLGEHVSQVAMRRHRIRELARHLYEFQSFDWFPVVIDNLGSRDVGSCAFELDAMWLMMIASPAVGTRSEVGEKGKDFDAFAVMDGVTVPVEVKLKSDRTAWTTNTVRNTVKGAARQLPKGDVGLLFLYIPFGWIGLRLEDEFPSALMEGTRQTTRLGAVVAVIDKPSLQTGLPVNRFLDYFREPDCPDHIWDFVMRLRQFWDARFTQMAPRAPF